MNSLVYSNSRRATIHVAMIKNSLREILSNRYRNKKQAHSEERHPSRQYVPWIDSFGKNPGEEAEQDEEGEDHSSNGGRSKLGLDS